MVINSETKTCSRCRRELPHGDFNKNRAKPGGLHNQCRDCQKVAALRFRQSERGRTYNRQYQRQRYHTATGKESSRKSLFKYRCGITIDEYNTMFDQPRGLCAICGCRLGEGQQTSVDHDHDTGKVRALLCHLCNVGLGFFRDSPEFLSKAVEYLRSHEQKEKEEEAWRASVPKEPSLVDGDQDQ